MKIQIFLGGEIVNFLSKPLEWVGRVIKTYLFSLCLKVCVHFIGQLNHLIISLRPHMTRNQMRVAIQSGCVTKILALQRWPKIDFPPEFQTRQMHSFPIMYNTMGSKLDGLAVKDPYLIIVIFGTPPNFLGLKKVRQKSA